MTNDKESWASKGRDGSVQVLFWNYTAVTPPDGKTDQIFFKMEQPAKPAGKTSLNISGLKNGQYTLKVYRTGYMQNDAYTAYLHMGSPQQLTRAQVASLQEAASGAPVETREVIVKDGSFISEYQLNENDTVLLTLQRDDR
jgi:xylan 1,4-beta-xylosidase